MKRIIKYATALILVLGMLAACDGGAETVETDIKETTAKETVSFEKESDNAEESSVVDAMTETENV